MSGSREVWNGAAGIVLEEGRILIGHIIVDHTENTVWDEKGKYPKVGYQIFYKMDIDQLYPFKAEHESSQRIIIPVNDVSSYYHKWNKLYEEILNEASHLK